ncbi:t-SNARE affecting a late Golgi compartment protein 2 [Tilletia horrida]|nr:t-SNARE affecting a late Golgi compartment protein 2 [Tilletia horrida]
MSLLGGGAGGSSASGSQPPAWLGVTRSRTNLFLSFRESAPRAGRGFGGGSRAGAGHIPNGAGESSRAGALGRKGTYFDRAGELYSEDGQAETAGLLDGADDPAGYPPKAATTVDISALPPKWVDISDEVDAILASIKPKITQLDRLHSKHLLPSFSDRTAEEKEIESMTQDITREFRKCSRLIGQLASQTRSLAAAGKASSHGTTMAQNVQTALATRVQDLSGVFRKKQSVYMQRMRGLEIRQADIQAASGLGGKGLIRDSQQAVLDDVEMTRQASSRTADPQLLLQEQELAPQDSDTRQIQRRDREIQQIAKSIQELAELFQDLSSLVIDQGTLLDRIDFNVETMGQEMNKAVEELNTASRTQRRTGRFQCILFLLLCIALLITLIFTKPLWRSSPSTPPPSTPPSNPNPAAPAGGGGSPDLPGLRQM